MKDLVLKKELTVTLSNGKVVAEEVEALLVSDWCETEADERYIVDRIDVGTIYMDNDGKLLTKREREEAEDLMWALAEESDWDA